MKKIKRIKKIKQFITALILTGLLLSTYGTVHAQNTAHWWITRADKAALLAARPSLDFKVPDKNDRPTIAVNPVKKYQTMDGFGFALTGGSAQHIIGMSADARASLLRELFGRGADDIGISYLRLSIGSSDLNDHTFSYDDLPSGQTDFKLDKFNLAEDTEDVIPVLKEILAINPKIKILGSPWSTPLWMKTNHNIQGGHLKKSCYAVYALYFVRYIKAMKDHGITIDAITVQNEPFNNGNTPSMQFFAKEELDFVKNYLGPLFKSSGIKTKIIIYDHNCDAPAYPISILTDPGARQYIDGSAFHLYAGPITALSKVHDAFPDKHVYFTEYMIVNFGKTFDRIAHQVSRIIIGATRNWSRNVILWNLAANSKFEPHTGNGGCDMCQGAVTIDGDTVKRNVAYYAMGQFSKFVPSGSVRIESTANDSLSNVAFQTPAGKTVLVVANKGTLPQKFNILYKGKVVQPTLDSNAIATFVW